MANKVKDIQDVTRSIQDWDATQEEVLLSRQLLSNIEKCGDRISITLTGKGVGAIAKVIQSYMREEEELQEDAQTVEDTLLSKQEVKEKFNVSDTTLWLWAKKNYLVPVKIGRKVMYRTSDIKQLVNGKM